MKEKFLDDEIPIQAKNCNEMINYEFLKGLFDTFVFNWDWNFAYAWLISTQNLQSLVYSKIQIGLNFLQGNDIGFNGNLSEIMRIVPKSEYDGTTTSNWSTQTTYSPSTSILFSIKDTLQTLEYKV